MMDKLIIDWGNSPTYTTIMGVFAGSSLIAVANVGKKLLKKEFNSIGWALNFGALGIGLLITGAGMVLTWPLKGQPFDNITFGETSLALGILDLCLALYFGIRTAALEQSAAPLHTLSKDLSPFRTVITGMGLGIIAIACGGYQHMIFVAPKEEPIAGDFALQHPTAENVGIASMFLFVGIAALFAVVFLSDFSKNNANLKWYHKVNYLLLQVAGWYFVISGALVFYTHIGLIIGTMK
jgi:uncharacterized membrane protein